MADGKAPNDIVLYWYKASPYGRRVTWYLALRNIDYAECRQPPILPRPDTNALGVHYRRSPVMAIGRDVYVDTKIIIARLEEQFPASAKHPALSTPETAGMAGLLQKLATEGMFQNAVRLIPPQSPMLQDEKFRKDRAEFSGGTLQLGSKTGRQDGLVNMRQMFELLESLFADGRQWVAGTKEPSLADLEGLWPVDWLINDLRPPKEYFSAEKFPKVYDWRKRFNAALDAARSRAQRPVSLKGEQAAKAVKSSSFVDNNLTIDPEDPTQLKQGTNVELFPLDGGGFTHQDRGKLLKLTSKEVAIAVQAPSGEEIHIHAPRWQFRVREIKGGAKL